MLTIDLVPGMQLRQMPLTSNNLLESFPALSRNQNQLLPTDFFPSDRDVICGRARENFHHDGNRFFRDLIQRSIGPYLAARTKIEKSDAIAKIVDKVYRISPLGGFVKKDSASGRWYRIKEAEARDKVGHAIRKAVQRLEETNPKAAERLRKEHASLRGELSTRAADDALSAADAGVNGATTAEGTSSADGEEEIYSAAVGKFSSLPTTAPSPEDAHRALLGTRSKERASLKSAPPRHEDRMADKASPRFLAPHGALDTARIASSSTTEQSHLEQNQLPFLRHVSLAQQDFSTREQLRRLQALNSNNSWNRSFQPMVLPPPQQSGLNSADVSQILAQRRMLAQQHPALYDRLSGNVPGGGRWNPTNPTMKLEETAKIQKEVIRQALHEQESKRLKELEYAQRLALSVTPAISDNQRSASLYSRIGAPRIGENPLLFASLKNSPDPQSISNLAARIGIADRGSQEHSAPARKPANRGPPA